MIGRALRHYLLAVQFFTRLPVTGRLAAWVGFSESALRASAAHFPGVGWLVGLIAALGWSAIATLLAPGTVALPLAVAAVAAVFSTAATVLATGAFHEDGLADVADGLGGSLDRDRALAIMKDSRLGTFGVLALLLAVAGKITLLVALSARGTQVVVSMLVIAHVLSRFAPLAIIRALRYAEADRPGEPRKAKPLADAISVPALCVALLWSAPALAWLGGVLGVASLAVTVAAAALVTTALARWFRRRLDGFTGDCLGATQQAIELLVYLAACATLLPSLSRSS